MVSSRLELNASSLQVGMSTNLSAYVNLCNAVQQKMRRGLPLQRGVFGALRLWSMGACPGGHLDDAEARWASFLDMIILNMIILVRLVIVLILIIFLMFLFLSVLLVFLFLLFFARLRAPKSWCRRQGLQSTHVQHTTVLLLAYSCGCWEQALRQLARALSVMNPKPECPAHGAWCASESNRGHTLEWQLEPCESRACMECGGRNANMQKCVSFFHARLGGEGSRRIHRNWVLRSFPELFQIGQGLASTGLQVAALPSWACTVRSPDMPTCAKYRGVRHRHFMASRGSALLLCPAKVAGFDRGGEPVCGGLPAAEARSKAWETGSEYMFQ